MSALHSETAAEILAPTAPLMRELSDRRRTQRMPSDKIATTV